MKTLLKQYQLRWHQLNKGEPELYLGAKEVIEELMNTYKEFIAEYVKDKQSRGVK